MPIIAQGIQAALRQAGIAKDDPEELADKLEKHNLSVDDALGILSDIAHGGDTNQKLKAVDTTLKLHKVLNNDSTQLPNISISIMDSFGNGEVPGINPILIPRSKVEIKKETLQ